MLRIPLTVNLAEKYILRKIISSSFILVLFIILTMVTTFPLFFKPNNSIAGFHSTDEPSLWYFWWLKYAHVNNLDHRNCQFLAYPFGQDYGIFNTLFPLWSAFKKITAVTTGQAFAYNIENILSFILSGLFVYILVEHISKNKLISIFSAIIYAFLPYHFARVWQHIGLAHIQWMPLYIYALFRLWEHKRWRNILFVSLALFLVASFDFYYLYFMLVVSGIFAIYCVFDNAKKNLRSVLHIAIAVTITLFILALFIWPGIKMSLFATRDISISVWNFNRPFEDLFTQSARPLSYFLPATTHPIFGKFTENFIGSSLYGDSFTEHALYLGWIPLVLAFVAFQRWKKYRKSQNINILGHAIQTEYFYIGFFIFLGIMAWFFSQPPWWNIFGFKLYMPSFFMYKILPMFRAYCRFGIVLMLAVAVLAGFGLKFILDKFKSKRTRIAVAIFFSCLVLFEFWNYPPFKVIDLSRVPQVYYWLKDEPGDFVIAEYPLDVNGPNELYKFYQTKHEKKIINGTIPGTDANKVAHTIRDLSDLNTARILKWMGVKYVLVHREDYLKTELIQDKEELMKIPQNIGLRFVRTFPAQECPRKDIMCVQKTGPIDVYKAVAQPVKPEM